MQKIIRILVGLALLIACIGVWPAAGQAETLYGITFGEQLITINTSTGAGSLVGNLSSNMDAYGLATWGGKLYTYDQSADRIQELNPATAATVATIDVGISEAGEGGLAFRSDGLGFLSDSDGDIGKLFSFDITFPSSTLISSLAQSMDGLDFNSADTLYGLSQSLSSGTKDLYIINQTTAIISLVGSTGVSNVNSLGGLAFRSDGVLFAAMNDQLYTLNTGTGTATLVGAINFSDVSGLAFLQPAPLPGSALLLFSGLLGVVAGGYRRFKKQ